MARKSHGTVRQARHNIEIRLTIIEHMTTASLKQIALKRVYEPACLGDGTRVLVDRLWPRGLGRDRAEVHAWLKALAPSDQLRRWFHARSSEWLTFRKLYLMELRRPETAQALNELYRLARGRSKLTLLFASKDEKHNNAVVLKDLLEGMRKPPTGTGPGAIRAMRERQAKRMPKS
jgi:uncharacterized protein YeaO (DUF488 family)